MPMNHNNDLTPANMLTTDETDLKAASLVDGVDGVGGVGGVDVVDDTTFTERLDGSRSSSHADETTTPERQAGRLAGSGVLRGRVKPQNKELRDRLEAARPLGYCAAQSPNARALIEAVTVRLIEAEQQTGQRGNERKAAGREKLTKAVEHFVGGILRCALDESRLVSRSMANNKSDFPKAGGVTYRQAASVVSGLKALGFITTYPGYNGRSKHEDGDFFASRVTRFEAQPSLIELAAQHGVAAATVMTDFQPFYPEAITGPTPPVRIRPLKGRLARHDEKGLFVGVVRPKTALALPSGPKTDEMVRLVNFANETLARHSFTGCLPPKLYRVFSESYALHGRWYAEGGVKGYTIMRKAERAAIRVDGEVMVELDISASWLSMAHGLLKLRLPGSEARTVPPTSDLYALAGLADLPRDLVKKVIVVAFGNGKLPRKKPLSVEARMLDDAGLTWSQAVNAVCKVYPFLRHAAEALKKPLGLERLTRYGKPEKLLPHRLMAREAEALTGAAEVLWRSDIPVLPLHDALIVPESRSHYAAQTLELSFHGQIGVTPRVVNPVTVYGDF